MGITNSQYDAIMRVYEKRRVDNHHVEEARRQAAYDAIPALGQLDRAVASLSVEALRRSLKGGKPQSGEGVLPASLGAHLKDAAGGMAPEQRRRQLLAAHGFPEDYLDPVYTCPDCHDTGWQGAKHCHCFDREVISLFYTQSGLSDILLKENFDTFDLSLYREDLIDERSGKSSRQIMTSALSACKRFAQGYGNGKQMDDLLLTICCSAAPRDSEKHFSHIVSRKSSLTKAALSSTIQPGSCLTSLPATASGGRTTPWKAWMMLS